MRFRPLSILGRAFSALAFVALSSQAQNSADLPPKELLAKETYVLPPAQIAKLVDAPRQMNVALNNLSPSRKYFLNTRGSGLPSLAAFGKPHYYLGGLQVDFRANRARSLTTRGASVLQVVDAATGTARELEVPKGATVSSAEWSPDGQRVAYLANFDDASRIYVADVATGKAKLLVQTPVLATLVTQLQWTADGRSIATVLIPDGRRPEPKRPEIETGPLVRLTDPAKNATRTYASLLRDPFEKEQLEWFTTGQVAIVDAKSGAVRKVGTPTMVSAVDISPDGAYLRVTTMQKPFSYTVQYSSFGMREELWDASGKVIAELSNRPLRNGDSDDLGTPAAGAGDSTARNYGWMPNGQGLYYLKQDPAPPTRGGDSVDAPRGNGQAQRRKDRVYQWAAPFQKGSEKVLVESDNRMSGVLFTEDGSALFVAENANGTGHVYATYLSEPGKRYTIWRMRGINASVGNGGPGFGGGGRGGAADSVTFYQNPGRLMTRAGRAGSAVALISSDGKYAYLSGTQYNKDWESQAPRPFVDKVEIKTGTKTRLFQSAADVFEEVIGALDDDMTKLVLSREAPNMVPDNYIRDLSSGSVAKLTNNVDPVPEFTNAVRKRVRVTRADGINFVVNLTLPQGYTAGTRLPAMLWLYPYEYTDQAGYDRTLRTENVNRFPQSGARTIEYLVTQGYAVANFSPPIIGESGRMNDNYVSDLQRNLIAVIDELDKQGFIDRTRLAIGGHSYGAFTTVNALVHTPYFKAGIAGDGMYNRSLTPNGFQSERRDFWEAQKTYLDMSPFYQADKMSGALLMYHSIEDQNVGTAPISSERMLHALESLGKTAALYMYPYEDHGPAARETLLDQWARWTAWLDVHVKNAGKKDPKIASN